MKSLKVKPGGKEPGTRFVGSDLKWVWRLAIVSGFLYGFIIIYVIFLILLGHISF